MVAAFQNASENLLVTYGRTLAVLVANVIRLCSVVPVTLLGYYFFGFHGFLWFNFLATIPVLIYLHSEQKTHGLLNLKSEVTRLAAAFIVFLICLAPSHLLLTLLPSRWLRLRLKRH
jgi:hypothetical protein